MKIFISLNYTSFGSAAVNVNCVYVVSFFESVNLSQYRSNYTSDGDKANDRLLPAINNYRADGSILMEASKIEEMQTRKVGFAESLKIACLIHFRNPLKRRPLLALRLFGSKVKRTQVLRFCLFNPFVQSAQT